MRATAVTIATILKTTIPDIINEANTTLLPSKETICIKIIEFRSAEIKPKLARSNKMSKTKVLMFYKKYSFISGFDLHL